MIRRLWTGRPIFVTAVLALSCLCFCLSTTSSSFHLLTGVRGQKSPAFSLYVDVVFPDESYKNQFMEIFKPLAEYVRLHEPETIAYELLLSDSDPKRLVVMERYQDKERAYLQVHKTSKPYLEFKPKFKAMKDAGHAIVTVHSYVDAMIGFGDRVQ